MKILYFNYDQNCYEIRKENNTFRFLVNGRNASLKEKKLFYYLIKQLIPSCSVYTSSLYCNGQEYKIYKDFIKDIYEFYPFDLKIYDKLNFMFNCQSDYVLWGFRENGTFKRIVKVGKITVVLFFASAIILSAKSSKDLSYNSEDKVFIADIETTLSEDLQKEKVILENIEDELFYSSYVKDSLNELSAAGEQKSYDDNTTPLSSFNLNNQSAVRKALKDALDKNQTLNSDEKEVFLGLEDFIVANRAYIDMNWYAKLLETKRIDYIQGRNYMAEARNYADNHMEIYNVGSITEADPAVITHELLHDFQRQNKLYWDDNPFFTETIDVLFNNEFFNVNNGVLYDTSYNFNLNYLYALMEIIGPQPIAAYNFSGDISYIKNALMEIIPDEKQAIALIELLNQLAKTSYSMYQNFSIETLLRSINYLLKEYYEAKFSKTFESDLLMLILAGPLNHSDLCSLLEIHFDGQEYNYYKINNIKYYLNADKLNESTFEFEIQTGDGTIKVAIGDDNRFIDKTIIKK